SPSSQLLSLTENPTLIVRLLQYVDHTRPLHPFPTRRSSDLAGFTFSNRAYPARQLLAWISVYKKFNTVIKSRIQSFFQFGYFIVDMNKRRMKSSHYMAINVHQVSELLNPHVMYVNPLRSFYL